MLEMPPQKGKGSDAIVSGPFIPFHIIPRKGRGSANVGWIVAENGCHIWRGTRESHGYPIVWHDGRKCVVTRARYELEVGPIPSGMDLDHFVCDNGAGGCCNPNHVRPVSHRENVLRSDGIAARNAAKTHCVHGHPLSGDNLYITTRTGARSCLTCRHRHSRRTNLARASKARAIRESFAKARSSCPPTPIPSGTTASSPCDPPSGPRCIRSRRPTR